MKYFATLVILLTGSLLAVKTCTQQKPGAKECLAIKGPLVLYLTAALALNFFPVPLN